MKLAMIALSTILMVHVIMTVMAQRSHDNEMKNLLLYVEQSTKIQRQICRAISRTEVEKNECTR